MQSASEHHLAHLYFIHFCEAYLGILPHFNLFRHLFWLNKKGGGGSKVVSGVYL